MSPYKMLLTGGCTHLGQPPAGLACTNQKISPYTNTKTQIHMYVYTYIHINIQNFIDDDEREG